TLRSLLEDVARDAAQRAGSVASLVTLGAPGGWTAAGLPAAGTGTALIVGAELAEESRKEVVAIRTQVARATDVIQLSDIDRELILRWMTGDDRVVFGGEPITGPPRR